MLAAVGLARLSVIVVGLLEVEVEEDVVVVVVGADEEGWVRRLLVVGRGVVGEEDAGLELARTSSTPPARRSSIASRVLSFMFSQSSS